MFGARGFSGPSALARGQSDKQAKRPRIGVATSCGISRRIVRPTAKMLPVFSDIVRISIRPREAAGSDDFSARALARGVIARDPPSVHR